MSATAPTTATISKMYSEEIIRGLLDAVDGFVSIHQRIAQSLGGKTVDAEYVVNLIGDAIVSSGEPTDVQAELMLGYAAGWILAIIPMPFLNVVLTKWTCTERVTIDIMKEEWELLAMCEVSTHLRRIKRQLRLRGLSWSFLIIAILSFLGCIIDALSTQSRADVYFLIGVGAFSTVIFMIAESHCVWPVSRRLGAFGMVLIMLVVLTGEALFITM